MYTFLWRRRRSLPALSPRLKQKDPRGSKHGAEMATQPSSQLVLLPELPASIVLHQIPGPQIFTDAPRRKIIVEVIQKNSAQKENTNQMLMQSLLSPSLMCPYAEQHGKSLPDEFTAEKTIWQSCTGNRSYVASFFNLSNIHKSSIFIKSMYSHFYKEVQFKNRHKRFLK